MTDLHDPEFVKEIRGLLATYILIYGRKGTTKLGNYRVRKVVVPQTPERDVYYVIDRRKHVTHTLTIVVRNNTLHFQGMSNKLVNDMEYAQAWLRTTLKALL